MRVLILGGFSPTYPRHRIIADGLRLAGVDLTIRSLPLGSSTLSRARLVLASLRDLPQFDAVLIPAFNQTLAPLIWLAGQIRRVPVLLDYMVGLSDVNEDRQTVTGFRAQLYRQIDRFNLRAIPAVTDTRQHIQAFERLLGTSLPRLRVLPVGVQPEWLDAPPPPAQLALTALFIGTFIPFQGVDVILEAAARLRDDPRIRFELVGSGQTFAQAETFVRSQELTNVTLVRGFFPIAELTQRAASAAVILGVFGAVEKTQYVVPNKIFDGMAMGRAVITADSAAVRELFTPGEQYLPVAPGDPAALAAALVTAASDLPRLIAIGTAARQRLQAEFLPQSIGRQLIELLTAKS